MRRLILILSGISLLTFQNCSGKLRSYNTGEGTVLAATPKIQQATVPRGYSLLDIQRSFGHCSDQYYYGPYPDLPDDQCTNQNRALPSNQVLSVYRVKVQAKAGDFFRVNGLVLSTNDGDQGALIREFALACAQNMSGDVLASFAADIAAAQTCYGNTLTVPPRDPVTGNICADWVSRVGGLCGQNASYQPAWWNPDIFQMVAPDGTRERSDASTQVAQLAVNGQLLGARTYQEHGYDWRNYRECDAPGSNCRGHLETSLAGLFTAPSDGEYTFDVQVAELASQPFQGLTIDTGGQITVEQYRFLEAANPTLGFGVAELSSTQNQEIMNYTPASCPGNDIALLVQDGTAHTVFQLSTKATTGDLVHIFTSITGTSRTPTDVDASALGIYRTKASDTVSPMLFLYAWSVYGTSLYYPWSAMRSDVVEKITSTEEHLYRAAVHSSDTPVECQTLHTWEEWDALGVRDHTVYGGLIQPGTGSMNLMRFTPLASAHRPTMLLQTGREYRTPNPQQAQIPSDGTWHTVFEDSFTLDKTGAARIHSQIVLQQDVTGTMTCLARVFLPQQQIAGGASINAIYNVGDNLTLAADLFQNLGQGTERFQFQVNCSSQGAVTIVPDGVYAGLETFSY